MKNFCILLFCLGCTCIYCETETPSQSIESPEALIECIRYLPDKPAYDSPQPGSYLKVQHAPLPKKPERISKSKFDSLTLLKQDEYEKKYENELKKWKKQCSIVEQKNNELDQLSKTPDYISKKQKEYEADKKKYDSEYSEKIKKWKAEPELAKIFSSEVQWPLELISISSTDDKGYEIKGISETGCEVTTYLPVSHYDSLKNLRKHDICIFKGYIIDWKNEEATTETQPAAKNKIALKCDSVKKSDKHQLLIFCGIKTKAKNIIFVMDSTGSMELSGGFKISKEKTRNALLNLSDRHSFNIIFANDRINMFQKRFVPASPEMIKKAEKFMEAYTGKGPSSLKYLLIKLRQLLKAENTEECAIFFISDGGLNDFDRKPFNFTKYNKPLKSLKCPVHAILFGSKRPESIKIMKYLADETGGEYSFLPSPE